MGFYGPRIEISARLSRHNSRGDKIDNLLYEELVERLRAVAGDRRYEHMNVDVMCDGIDWKDD